MINKLCRSKGPELGMQQGMLLPRPDSAFRGLVQHFPGHTFSCTPNYQIFFLNISSVTFICIVSLPTVRHQRHQTRTFSPYFRKQKAGLLKTSIRTVTVNLLASLATRKLLKASGSGQITKAVKYFRN